MTEAGELNDWELLQNSNTCLVSSSNLTLNSRDLEGIDGDSEGVVQSDYFALDSEKPYLKTASGREEDEGLFDSDKPSWVDPDSDSRDADDEKRVVGLRVSSEMWSDSASEGSEGRKYGDFEGKSEMGVADCSKSELGLEAIEIDSKNSGEFLSDSGGSVFPKISIVEGEGELGIDEHPKTNGGAESGAESVNLSSDVDGEAKSGDGENRRMVWWKLPFELLKFWAFRVSPIWSISIAAAAMGFVILGRRLYAMKHKSRSVPLRISMDDKKISQFMKRKARLNEAFSVVRRPPIVRSSLPAAGGVTPWPVMSLR